MNLEKVLFSSRTEIEKHPGVENVAVISISESKDRQANISNIFSSVLYLKFDDVDINTDKTKKLFTMAQADEIWDFVENLPDTTHTLWIHCLFGVSRSAGVAKAIADNYNLPFPEHYAIYNKKVYRTMRQSMLHKMYPNEEGLYI